MRWVAAVVLFFVTWASPAYADNTAPCMTKGEWNKLALGMPKADVIALLDGPGTKNPYQARSWWYPKCGKDPAHHRVFIQYKDGVLRSALWMHLTGAEWE